jgi:hypothetical protein
MSPGLKPFQSLHLNAALKRRSSTVNSGAGAACLKACPDTNRLQLPTWIGRNSGCNGATRFVAEVAAVLIWEIAGIFFCFACLWVSENFQLKEGTADSSHDKAVLGMTMQELQIPRTIRLCSE